jgi:Ca-activated chloride channel family protein
VLTLLEPAALWLLGSLPIIVLLYLVRERKREQEVSAIFLWTEAKALARRRRRISPTLLLLLQLLFAALLALALAQPRLNVAGAPPRVFVLDASASMAALEPGGTRLGQAVSQAQALLDGAGEVAVVRAGLGARVVQPLTGDHEQVRQVLGALRATDAEAAVGEALSLARSLIPGAEVHLFSDRDKPPGFTEVVTHPVGEDAPNVGISAFELAYGQLFVSVVSNTPYPQEVTLVVTQDGSQDGAEDGAEVRNTLLVPAQGQANLSLPVASEAGLYQARLEGVREDALALDNSAFAGSRELNVRLLGEAPAVERLLRALPGTRLGAQAEAEVTVSVGDPVGSAGQTSGQPPAGDAVLFAPPHENPVYSEVADWARSDPLLRFVDLTGVVVAPAAGPLPLPRERAEVLAQTADLTPVLLRWRDAGRELVYFRFHPSQSDLTRRPAFPILLANLLEGFRSEAQVPLGTPLGEGLWLSEPGRSVVAGRAYTAAPLPAAESRLSVSAVATEPGPDAQPVAGSSAATRNPALWLVACALAVLVAEWLFWSRGRLGPSLSRSRKPPLARR